MKFKKEVQIGLLTVLALVLGYIGINYLKGIEIFKKTTTYYAHFDNLNSVTVATPVIVSGFKVGSVRDVRFDYSRGYGATVEMALDPHVRVSSKSIVKIKMNPLSGSELVLTIDGHDPRTLADGDTISSISPSGDLLSIATDQILPAVNNMMPTITQTLVRLDTLLHDKSIDSVLLALKGSSMQLHAMMAALNQSSQPQARDGQRTWPHREPPRLQRTAHPAQARLHDAASQRDDAPAAAGHGTAPQQGQHGRAPAQ